MSVRHVPPFTVAPRVEHARATAVYCAGPRADPRLSTDPARAVQSARLAVSGQVPCVLQPLLSTRSVSSVPITRSASSVFPQSSSGSDSNTRSSGSTAKPIPWNSSHATD